MRQLLKKNPLYILLGILIIPIFILIYSFFSSFFDFFKVKDPVPDYSMSENGSVISDSVAKSLAEQVFNSMNQLGTNEVLLFDAFKGLNLGDFGKVYNFFGKRPFIEFIGVGTNSDLLGVNFDLYGWIQHDLTTDEYLKLKRLYPLFF
ncbi:hypothetical protein PL373_17470 [Tenacibaculum maritimum]|nr:hypothetical protein [Tenacibaculum maritimum]